MTKEILEQAVLDYIGEKFKDKVVDKRVQTFFTYSELVDTVLSFAELLNKNFAELEQQIEKMKRYTNCAGCIHHKKHLEAIAEGKQGSAFCMLECNASHSCFELKE